MNEEDKDKTVMVVEVTAGILRHARSSGTYANLSGHEVDFIAFLSHQGTFLAEVESIRKKVPLREIYPEMQSKNKTTLYRIKAMTRHPLKSNSKLPRGRKRITTYEKFMNARVTTDLFKSMR